MLHVRDIAHPDSAAQAADVETVLRDLGLDELIDRRRPRRSAEQDRPVEPRRPRQPAPAGRARPAPAGGLGGHRRRLRSTARRDRSPPRRGAPDRRSAAAPSTRGPASPGCTTMARCSIAAPTTATSMSGSASTRPTSPGSIANPRASPGAAATPAPEASRHGRHRHGSRRRRDRRGRRDRGHAALHEAGRRRHPREGPGRSSSPSPTRRPRRRWRRACSPLRAGLRDAGRRGGGGRSRPDRAAVGRGAGLGGRSGRRHRQLRRRPAALRRHGGVGRERCWRGRVDPRPGRPAGPRRRCGARAPGSTASGCGSASRRPRHRRCAARCSPGSSAGRSLAAASSRGATGSRGEDAALRRPRIHAAGLGRARFRALHQADAMGSCAGRAAARRGRRPRRYLDGTGFRPRGSTPAPCCWRPMPRAGRGCTTRCSATSRATRPSGRGCAGRAKGGLHRPRRHGLPDGRASAAKGHEVTVYNRTAPRADGLGRQAWRRAAQTPAEAARDAARLHLRRQRRRRAQRGLAPRRAGRHARRARSSSTTPPPRPRSPARSRRRGQGAGVGFVDAPVSGGQAGAENGQLTVMCGGETAAFARAKPVIDAYAQACVLMGAAGLRPARQDGQPDLHRRRACRAWPRA